jgi:hypothetical protein
MGPQSCQHGIGGISHPGLERKKLFRDSAGLLFFQQKLDHMVRDLPAHCIFRAERRHLVRLIGFNNTHHLFRIHLGIGPADPGQGRMHIDGGPPWRRGDDKDIRQFPEPVGVVMVDLDNHLVGTGQPGGRSTYGSGKIHTPVRGDLRGFHDRHIDVAEKPGTHGLGQVGQVHVHIFHFLAVDLIPQFPAALVRGPPLDGIGLCQIIVNVIPGRCPGEHPDPEISALAVFRRCMFSQYPGNGLGAAGRGKA